MLTMWGDWCLWSTSLLGSHWCLGRFSLFGSSNPPAALQGYCGGDCTKEDFDRRRAVELKHGRICMFATIGSLAFKGVLDMVDLRSICWCPLGKLKILSIWAKMEIPTCEMSVATKWMFCFSCLTLPLRCLVQSWPQGLWWKHVESHDVCSRGMLWPDVSLPQLARLWVNLGGFAVRISSLPMGLCDRYSRMAFLRFGKFDGYLSPSQNLTLA